MNVNSSQLYWTALLTLLVSVASVGRLGAQESDDEPEAARSTTDDSRPDANSADEGDSAEHAEAAQPAETGVSNETAAAGPGAEDSGSDEAAAAPPVKIPTAAAIDAAVESEVSEADHSEGENRAAQPEPGDGLPSLRPAKTNLTVEAASFKGIQPGKSTGEDLAEAWGPPSEIRKVQSRRLQTYRIEAFPKVTVSVTSGVVTSIVVNLDKPMGAEDLVEQLSLDDISSVQVNDDMGQLLGEAFPERGVLFSYAPKAKTPQVSQVVLEPIDAAPFLLRAESQLHTHYARCLADANAALDHRSKIHPSARSKGQGLSFLGRFLRGPRRRSSRGQFGTARTRLETAAGKNLDRNRRLSTSQGADSARARRQERSAAGQGQSPCFAGRLFGDHLGGRPAGHEAPS